MVITQTMLDESTLPVDDTEDLVRIKGLRITVPARGGRVEAVRGASFTVKQGEALGIVGESGSGKTLTCRALLGVLPSGCEVSSGSIAFDGDDLSALGEREWRDVYGTRMGAVFQDPGSYLNPAAPVGRQIREVLQVKAKLSRKAAKRRAIELLGQMGLQHPERVYSQVPSELSGGMLQRVLLAIAVSCDPELVVADEATTALDVTTQAEVIALLKQLQRELGLAIVFVSHDLAVVQELCDRVVVFYSGEVVEVARLDAVVEHPYHPYTSALLAVSSLVHDGTDLPVIPGQAPAPAEAVTGCRFASRCAYATDECRQGPIPLRELTPGRFVRCIRAEQLEMDVA
jgi:peptide/nickel transport system ATP-binding protein